MEINIQQLVSLPLSHIQVIMTSSPEVTSINQEALVLTTKAMELFVKYFWLFATPWTVAHQAPLSMGFSRQECWSGLPSPFPGDLPNLGTEPRSPVL